MEGFIADGRYMVLAEVVVAKPELVRHGDNSVFALNFDLSELDATGAEELLPTICHDPSHVVD